MPIALSLFVGRKGGGSLGSEAQIESRKREKERGKLNDTLPAS